jgi:hypothetical protein
MSLLAGAEVPTRLPGSPLMSIPSGDIAKSGSVRAGVEERLTVDLLRGER